MNLGHEFEELFYAKLKQFETFQKIYTESWLCKHWGFSASSVDFLIELEDSVIMMQLKFMNTRRRENKSIENYIKSIHYVLDQVNKPLLFGLWISRLCPFEDNINKMLEHKINCIHYHGSMDELVGHSILSIQELLRAHGKI